MSAVDPRLPLTVAGTEATACAVTCVSLLSASITEIGSGVTDA
jgi:hypothetical protein